MLDLVGNHQFNTFRQENNQERMEVKKEPRNPVVSWVVPAKVLEAFDPLKPIICEHDLVGLGMPSRASPAEARNMQSDDCIDHTSSWSEQQEQALPQSKNHVKLDQAARSAMEKLWVPPRVPLRYQPSDASLQKTRTSANVSVTMIPANHAKTTANERLDFYEDSMQPSVIEKMQLYRLNWTRHLSLSTLEDLSQKAFLAFFLAAAPVLCDSDKHVENCGWDNVPCSCQGLEENRANTSSDEPHARDYWLTYCYLSKLQMQESLALYEFDRQILVPASIARYIALLGVGHQQFQDLAYDAETMLRDYEVLKRGPWGR